MRTFVAAIFLAGLLALSATARDITVATWNLGWHVDKATAAEWITKCNARFEQDAVTGVWKPSTSGAGIPGWDVNFRDKVEWDWSKFPVCDVYKDRNFDTVPVTVGAYDKRLQQLNDFLQNTVPVDIYAFQEVNGEQAVREACRTAAAATTSAVSRTSRFSVSRSRGRRSSVRRLHARSNLR